MTSTVNPAHNEDEEEVAVVTSPAWVPVENDENGTDIEHAPLEYSSDNGSLSTLGSELMRPSPSGSLKPVEAEDNGAHVRSGFAARTKTKKLMPTTMIIEKPHVVISRALVLHLRMFFVV